MRRERDGEMSGMNRKNNIRTGYVMVIAASVIYGIMPILAKCFYFFGANAITLVFLRNLFSVPVLLLITKLQGGKIRQPAKHVSKIALLGLLGTCVTPVLLYLSYDSLSSGAATAFHYVYPIVVALGGILFLKEKPKAMTIFCIVLCIAGVACSFDAKSGVNPIGAVTAILSGVVYAVYVLMLSSFKGPKLSGFHFNFYAASATSVVMGVMLLLTTLLKAPAQWTFQFPVSVWGFVAVLGFAVLFNVGAVVLFQQGTMILGGSRAAILSTLEPVTSIVADWLLILTIPGNILGLGAAPTLLGGIGAVLIIVAGLLLTIFDKKELKKDK